MSVVPEAPGIGRGRRACETDDTPAKHPSKAVAALTARALVSTCQATHQYLASFSLGQKVRRRTPREGQRCKRRRQRLLLLPTPQGAVDVIHPECLCRGKSASPFTRQASVWTSRAGPWDAGHRQRRGASIAFSHASRRDCTTRPAAGARHRQDQSFLPSAASASIANVHPPTTSASPFRPVEDRSSARAPAAVPGPMPASAAAGRSTRADCFRSAACSSPPPCLR